jgi:hypothetical protein
VKTKLTVTTSLVVLRIYAITVNAITLKTIHFVQIATYVTAIYVMGLSKPQIRYPAASMKQKSVTTIMHVHPIPVILLPANALMSL